MSGRSATHLSTLCATAGSQRLASVGMLLQIGTMLYTGRRQWKFSEAAPVGASVMMVPVVFAVLLLVSSVVMLAIWLLSSWWVAHTLAAYTKLPQVRLLNLCSLSWR